MHSHPLQEQPCVLSLNKQAFVASLNSNVSVLFTSSGYTIFYTLDGVRSSLTHIVFVFTSPSHSLRIMCLAYNMGMIYTVYQWVIISRRLSAFVAENVYPYLII